MPYTNVPTQRLNVDIRITDPGPAPRVTVSDMLNTLAAPSTFNRPYARDNAVFEVDCHTGRSVLMGTCTCWSALPVARAQKIQSSFRAMYAAKRR